MINIQSRIINKLLGYYFVSPQTSHYINELARLLNLDLGNLHKKLIELEKEGLFSSEFRGQQKYYFLNKKYPLMTETKRMYEANFGLEKTLVDGLKKIKGLKKALIFGSYAKGRFGKDSDIDLLLVGSHSSLDAQKLISDLQSKIKREINIVDFTEKEFNDRVKKKDDFIKNITQQSVINLV
jgi:predicted nucleotidyltransferase